MDDSLSIESLCASCHPDKCCTRFLRVPREDMDRWNAEGREDILAHIQERVLEGRLIYEVSSPGKGCVFLKDCWCSIHETRPIVCRNFLCMKAMELKAMNNW